jgi:hypothetical protein
MGAIAGIGLLVVGGVALFVGIGNVRSDALSVLAAAACFAVSVAAFGLVFCTVIRK